MSARYPTPPVIVVASWLVQQLSRLPNKVRHAYARHRSFIRHWFPRLFVISSLAILALTTLLWSYLGARLQAGNADQLVDPYLFQNTTTLHGAVFPAAHTFLIKWPLFWLVAALGATPQAYIVVTIGVSLVTVAALAVLLYWLERRPYVYGLLILALASVLLVVPPQPHPGALLPVNMAMLATRNIEYVVYGLALFVTVRGRRLWGASMVSAAVLLGLLVASDRLFVGLAVGASVLLGLWAALCRSRDGAQAALRLMTATLVGVAVSVVCVAVVSRSSLAQISAGSAGSPYDIGISLHQLALGSWYAVLGMLSELGANPAYDALTVREIPHTVLTHFTQPMGLTLLINGVIVAAGVVAVVAFARTAVPKRHAVSSPELFTGLLVATIITALGLFVGTKHDYSVDARYLAVVLPALLAALALGASRVVWQRRVLIIAGGSLLIGIVTGVSGAVQMYYQSSAAASDISVRNELVAQTLRYHHTSLLVGDYWRVLPIRSLAHKPLTAMPLGGCTTPQQFLTSRAWQPDLRTHSFAYLFSTERGPAGFPTCSIDEVTKAYGRPSASTVISGTLEHPREQLLFYDQGSGHSAASNRAGTILPVELSSVPPPVCAHQTVAQVVAHQDDDLLFMNPDLAHSLAAGDCVRSIYVTAGDAGSDLLYWQGREQAAKAAYAQMLGHPRLAWVTRTVKLGDRQFVTLASPAKSSQVTLIFMHLPDGNLRGEGFKAMNYQSLGRLLHGSISQVATIDHQTTYTLAELQAALTQLLGYFHPSQIRTQAAVNLSARFPDHNDHLSVGRLTALAYETYHEQHPDVAPLAYYIGYPVRERAPNLTSDQERMKGSAFYAYAAYDPDVCDSDAHCESVPTYRAYLQRQYSYPAE